MNMLEDFTRINHIFCDKTGTLTKNELIFRQMFVDDTCFKHDESFSATVLSHEKSGQFFDFFRCLTICHDAVIKKNS